MLCNMLSNCYLLCVFCTLSCSDYSLYVFYYSFHVCFLILYVLLSVLCVLYFLLFCVLFRMYIVVSFLFFFKFTDHCHRVETQMQLINIIYHIQCISSSLLSAYESEMSMECDKHG